MRHRGEQYQLSRCLNTYSNRAVLELVSKYQLNCIILLHIRFHREWSVKRKHEELLGSSPKWYKYVCSSLLYHICYIYYLYTRNNTLQA